MTEEEHLADTDREHLMIQFRAACARVLHRLTPAAARRLMQEEIARKAIREAEIAGAEEQGK